MNTEANEQERLRSLWEGGEPLSVAWVAFSADDDAEALEAIRSGSEPQDSARVERAQAACLRRLRSGELQAIGILESFMGGGERRARVRAGACRAGFVNWTAQKISDGAHTYWKVRVAEHAPASEDGFAQQSTAPPEQANVRPPALRAQRRRGAVGLVEPCTEVLANYVVEHPKWDGAISDRIVDELNARLKIYGSSNNISVYAVQKKTWYNRKDNAQLYLVRIGISSPSRWVPNNDV